jgi:hypothetical protein
VGGVPPRNSTAHASTNLHSDRPSATAWCTVTPRPESLPATLETRGLHGEQGSGQLVHVELWNEALERLHVVLHVAGEAAHVASDSATTNLTPSEAEERTATSPVSARWTSLPAIHFLGLGSKLGRAGRLSDHPTSLVPPPLRIRPLVLDLTASVTSGADGK